MIWGLNCSVKTFKANYNILTPRQVIKVKDNQGLFNDKNSSEPLISNDIKEKE